MTPRELAGSQYCSKKAASINRFALRSTAIPMTWQSSAGKIYWSASSCEPARQCRPRGLSGRRRRAQTCRGPGRSRQDQNRRQEPRRGIPGFGAEQLRKIILSSHRPSPVTASRLHAWLLVGLTELRAMGTGRIPKPGIWKPARKFSCRWPQDEGGSGDRSAKLPETH